MAKIGQDLILLNLLKTDLMKMKFTRRKFLSLSGGALPIVIAGQACNSIYSGNANSSKSKKTIAKTEVLVVGGGPAGIGAALGAARQGRDVFLIENYGFFGGVGAWSLGMQINQMRPGAKPRSVVHEMLLSKLESYGPMAVRVPDHQLLCNVEYLKVAILDAFDEAGVKYLVHTRAVDTIVNNDIVTGVVVATKSGLMEIQAKVVIDCTGDADIAWYAGAETMKEEGNLSPQTLLFNYINGPLDKLNAVKIIREGEMSKALEKYPLMAGSFFSDRVANCSFSFVNHAGTRDMGNFDCTDPFQFTQAECKSRRQVVQMINAFREFGTDEFRNVEICNASPQIGVRETRRVKGGYVLTEEDSMTGARFDDVIAWRSGYLDIGFVHLSKMKIHQVPYRAIVPEKIDGLLMAGRCISATHEAASAGKSMGNCVATGHAAGIAASIAVIQNRQPREIDIAEVQNLLRKDEVDLDKGGEDQSDSMTG